MSTPTSLSFFHNDLWAPPFFREKSIIHQRTSPLFWLNLSLSRASIQTISLFVSPARGSFSQSPLDGWSFFLWRVQSSRHYRLPFQSRVCFVALSLPRALPVFLCVPYFMLAVRSTTCLQTKYGVFCVWFWRFNFVNKVFVLMDLIMFSKILVIYLKLTYVGRTINYVPTYF